MDQVVCGQRAEAPPESDPVAQSGAAAPPGGYYALLQEGTLVPFHCQPSIEGVVQPFPRSPKLLRKIAELRKVSEEQLLRRLAELETERNITEAHIQSLKKRRANLSRSTEVMKQEVRERFGALRAVLQKDEQEVLDALELDCRETSTRLDKVLKDWDQHLSQVQKSIATTQKSMGHSGETQGNAQTDFDNLSHKKTEASEAEIRLNEDRFEKLLKNLNTIFKDLKAQLQRKNLLLDSSHVMIDRQTCHRHITVTGEGQGMCFSGSAHSAPEHPLQFDKVCCALGSAAVTTGRCYWEADVRWCSAWAVGVAYGCLERKGRNKGAKLGRNRNSWCVELRDGCLLAWHNDRNVACHAGPGVPDRVGVWVNYEKGKLAFYDAQTMNVLQEFSAALTSVFDRAHHQFTEPLYPAFRFLRPAAGHLWPGHMAIRDVNTLP
ncbi:E3 ubiquitin-protein ligase TRIM62 [Esox lucius]|uniref:B30.2/SPRY domain-containing protein n=1 Tax=Esox lucius TaxID=8010 RepID=A0A6Q2Z673_ESOLU|nr:E3 ubiquitin-protein ligase TRIM62 [Esox lucius]